ncbi:tigger transposable element-derived protein 1-like [Ochlerotatus camptorhynchus]|uniref:tigger transposable element-derived protein 1-like n=1 Tax=Ochlerotatus camptorhynchus TaxID=644619 RepID=UPI0031D435C0
MDLFKPNLPIKVRQRRSFSLAEKMTILDRLSKGLSATKIAREYNVNESTIRHMRKQEATIRMAAHSMTSKIASGSKRNRNLQMSKMEACLNIWLDDMRAKRLPISHIKVKSKALKLYELIGKHELYEHIGFSASNGWFERFKRKFELYELRPQDDRAPSNEIEFRITTKGAIAEGNISNDQIFTVDNTVFSWKRLPQMEGEYNVTMLFCCNATGNFITPPVLYSNEASEPTSRSVFVQLDRPGSISTQNVRNWFYTFFVPKAENYLSESNLSDRAIVLLAHDQNYPKDLVHHSFDIAVFPADCNSSCLPTGQGILTHFNAVYLKRLSLKLKDLVQCGKTLQEAWDLFSIDDATEILETMITQLDSRAMRNGWARLLDGTVEDHSNDEIVQDTVDILHSIGLESVTVEALHNQITPQELSNEEVIEIYFHHQKELDQSNLFSFGQPPSVEKLPAEEYMDPDLRNTLLIEINHHMLALKNAQKFFEENDKNKARSEAITKRLKQVHIWMREMKNEVHPPDPVEIDPIDIKIEPVEFSVEMIDSD